MKGTIKAIKRTPHLMTSKVGMSAKSSDAETEDLKRRFTVIEEETNKLFKDAKSYRESVNNMLNSSTNFATAFVTLFNPIGSEGDLSVRYPSAQQTIEQIGNYQDVIADLKDTIQPELELVDTRIIAPVKEFMEILKQVKKTITKRDHKLIDFDRHNNAYIKLRDKKEKSLKDEQNLFKVEQDYDASLQDYEYFNNLIKTEIPRFMELTTAFISPLFYSFYYMQLNILYITLEKMQTFAGEKFDMGNADLVGIYQEKMSDTAETIENLSITKRFASTAKIMSDRRQNSYDSSSTSPTSAYRSPPPLSAKPSLSSSAGRPPIGAKPPLSSKPSYSSASSRDRLPPMPSAGAAPPAYSPTSGIGGGSLAGKRPPPPPPPMPPKPRQTAQYVTALYDFTAQAAGDLSFRAGDQIELVKKTESTEDWWTGRVNGQEGAFPANYCQE